MATNEQIKTITDHYLLALLWTMPGDDENENPGDSLSIHCDLGEGVREQAESDVRAFVEKCGLLFDQTMACFDDGYGQHPDAGSAEAAFGQDFALTRNGHGVGFWDREDQGLPNEMGEALTELCDPGECNLYVGDDGKAYFD